MAVRVGVLSADGRDDARAMPVRGSCVPRRAH